MDEIYNFVISKCSGDSVCEDVTLWCNSSTSDIENYYEMHEASIRTSPDINEERTSSRSYHPSPPKLRYTAIEKQFSEKTMGQMHDALVDYKHLQT